LPGQVHASRDASCCGLILCAALLLDLRSCQRPFALLALSQRALLLPRVPEFSLDQRPQTAVSATGSQVFNRLCESLCQGTPPLAWCEFVLEQLALPPHELPFPWTWRDVNDLAAVTKSLRQTRDHTNEVGAPRRSCD
jgi:hypothetical protein